MQVIESFVVAHPYWSTVIVMVLACAIFGIIARLILSPKVLEDEILKELNSAVDSRTEKRVKGRRLS